MAQKKEEAQLVSKKELVGFLLCVIGMLCMANDYPPGLEPETMVMLRNTVIGGVIFAIGVCVYRK